MSNLIGNNLLKAVISRPVHCVCLSLVAIAFVLPLAPVFANFPPGHLFTANPQFDFCQNPELIGDQIIAINIATGESWLFAELGIGDHGEDFCGLISGLALSRNGTRLRAAMTLTSLVFEFDSNGNFKQVLESSDGINAPRGRNCVAFDASDNFFVVNSGTQNIMRFPSNGGPGAVFADSSDGITGEGHLAFSAGGKLFYAGSNSLVRFDARGLATPFDAFAQQAVAIAADSQGLIYVGFLDGTLRRYHEDDPLSGVLISSNLLSTEYGMAVSLDNKALFITTQGSVYTLDIESGSFEKSIPNVEGFCNDGGSVLIPGAAIPTTSAWALLIFAMAVITVATVLFSRMRKLS